MCGRQNGGSGTPVQLARGHMPSPDRAGKAHRRNARRKTALKGRKTPRSPFTARFPADEPCSAPLQGDEAHGDLPPADAELDRILIQRGWVLFDRHPNGDMYDWPPSTTDPTGPNTYLIVDSINRGLSEHRYRASSVDGTRRTFADRHNTVATLDDIEAPRA